MTAYFLIMIQTVPSSYLAPVPNRVAAFRQHAEAVSKDIAFGQRQVEQFTCDRPGTAKLIEQHKFLRWTLVWYFSGRPTGQRVYWNCEEPRGISEAEHSPAWEEYPAMIWVSSKVSPVDQSACLLFELLNFRVDAEYENPRGLSRNEFAESCARLEHRALRNTKTFLFQHPIRKINYNTDKVYFRLMTSIEDEDDYISYLNSQPTNEYFDYYRRMYDGIASRRVQKQNDSVEQQSKD
jgi:hypothetical protein